MAAGYAGSYLIVAMIIIGVGVLLALPSYTALSRAMPTNGATYRYASLLHKDAGIVVAVAMIIAATVGGLPLSAVVAGDFFAFATDLPALPIAIASLVIFYLVNVFGLRTSSIVQTVFVILLLLALVLFATRASLGTTNFGISGGSPGGIVPAVAMMYTLMAGALFIIDFGDEVRDPSRTMPKALWVSMIAVFVVYLIVDLGILASDQSAEQMADGLLFDVAEPFLSGPEMAFFVIAGGVLATVSTMNGLFGFISRVIAQLAEERALPSVFGRTNRWGAPTWALTGMFVVSLGVLFLELPNNLLGGTVNLGVMFSVAVVVFSGAMLPSLHEDLWKAGQGRFSARTVRVTAAIALLINIAAFVLLLIQAWMVAVTMAVVAAIAVACRHYFGGNE